MGARALHRHVLDLDDLLRVRFGQRAAEHGEILGEGKDRASIHGAPAGDHAVAGDLAFLHAELGRAVLDKHVELLEGALVREELEALARGELAALVLRCDARLAASRPRPRPALFQLFQNVFHAPLPPSFGAKIHSTHGHLRVSCAALASAWSIGGEQHMFKAFRICAVASILPR